MSLHQLYAVRSGSLNPSGATGLAPGGAGVQNAASSVSPGISAPSLEQYQREVFDVTSTKLLIAGTTLGDPAPVGKLLVVDPVNSIFGAQWKLNTTVKQAIPNGAYGIVVAAGQASDVGLVQTTSNGQIAVPGSKAVVVTAGPVPAFVQTTVGAGAISAGMPLAADGAGNLTWAGSSPNAGTVLGTLMGATVAASVSIPVLSQVYLGGY